jgi:hypothetical protein
VLVADDSTRALAKGLLPLVSRVRTDATARRTPEGRQTWTSDVLDSEALARHLNGGPARGVSFIKPGEAVTMVAVLDFDSHDGACYWAQMSEAVGRVVDVLELSWGMSPVLFRSGGGRGVHLYLVWEAAQDCYSVRAWLAEVLGACGLSVGTGGVAAGECEIFPKRDSVAPGKYGNQVILPLSRESVPLELDNEEPLW